MGASPAAAANGQFTQVLCADPAANRGVGGGLPNEIRVSTNNSRWNLAPNMSSCPTRHILSNEGILMSSSGGTYGAGTYTSITYTVPTGLELRAGTIYRSLVNYAPNNGFLAINQNAGTEPDNIWAEPRNVAESGDWYSGNVNRRGVTSGSFVPQNRVDLLVRPRAGWTITAACVANATTCDWSNTQWIYAIHGGTMNLYDSSDPTVSNIHGSLSTNSRLRGTETLEFTASDVGSGVYRAALEVNGTVLARNVIDNNGGRCASLSTTDAYRFANAVPCKLSVGSGRVSFDTSRAPEGVHNVRVLVEDAAGNQTVALSRRVEIDNLQPPTNTAPPTISTGSVTIGDELTGTSGAWSAVPSAAVSYQWFRCPSGVSPGNGVDGCESITGATAATYTATTADAYSRLVLRVLAYNSEGSSTATSAPSAIVTDEHGQTAPLPRNNVAPSWLPSSNVIDPRPSEVLEVARGDWSGPGLTFSFRFSRCSSVGVCSTVQDGTRPSYVVVDGDVGQRIVAEVSGTNSHGSTTASTPLTGVVLEQVRRGGGDDTPKPPPTSPPGGSPGVNPPVPVLPDIVVPVAPLPGGNSDAPRPVPVPNGRCEGAAAKLVARFAKRSSATVRWGKGAKLTLTLTCVRTGKPVSGAELVVTTTANGATSSKSKANRPKTNNKGQVVIRLGRGPSRSVAIGWRPDSLATTYAVQTSAKLLVRSRVTFKVGPRKVRPGKAVRMTGKVAGAPKGVTLNVQAKDGKRWRTFDQVKTAKKGKFSYTYKFKRSKPGARFTFRVQLPNGQKKLGTLPGTSKSIGVRIA